MPFFFFFDLNLAFFSSLSRSPCLLPPRWLVAHVNLPIVIINTKTNATVKKKLSARRARLGLLEKKSDYQARAADFHKKEATLKSLARKAEARNPDEFYFGMHKARTEKGVAVVE